MKLLSMGSVNIDLVYSVDHLVKEGESIQSEKLSNYFGGKGLNQTVAVARAGMPVYFAGKIGSDGCALIEVLKDEPNIHAEYLLTDSEERTGHAIIQVDRHGENSIIVYGGANQRITETDIDRVLSHFSEGDIVILQNEISCIGHLLNRAHERGMQIIFTPAPFSNALREMQELQYVDWLLLNQVEGSLLTGSEDEPYTTCKKIKHLFPGIKIILTLEKNGSVYYDGIRFISQKSYKIQTVDTTAAGDTFAGYFVASLLSGSPVGESLDLASKAAAISVSRKGAYPSMPTMDEVRNWNFEDNTPD